MSAFSGDGQYGVEYGAVDILADKLQDGQKILGSDVGRYNDGLTVAGGGTGFYHNIDDDKLSRVREHQAVAQEIDPDKYTDVEKMRLRMMGFGRGNAAEGTAEFDPATSWRNEQLYRPDPEDPGAEWVRGLGYELGVKDGQLYQQEVSPRAGAAIGWDLFGDSKFFRGNSSGQSNWADAVRRNGGMLGVPGGYEELLNNRMHHNNNPFEESWVEKMWRTGLTPEEYAYHLEQMERLARERYGGMFSPT